MCAVTLGPFSQHNTCHAQSKRGTQPSWTVESSMPSSALRATWKKKRFVIIPHRELAPESRCYSSTVSSFRRSSARSTCLYVLLICYTRHQRSLSCCSILKQDATPSIWTTMCASACLRLASQLEWTASSRNVLLRDHWWIVPYSTD